MNILNKIKNTVLNTAIDLFVTQEKIKEYSEKYSLFVTDQKEIEEAEKNFKRDPFSELAANNYRNTRVSQSSDSGLLGHSTRSYATQLYTFREMELCFLDTKVQSCYDRLLNDVFQYDLNVISADNETPVALELKEFIEHINSEIDGSIEEVLKASLKVGIHFGYSPSEIVYKLSEEPDFYGKRILRSIKSKRPGLFSLEGDDYDNLLGIKCLAETDQPLIDKDKFFLYSHNKLFSNFYGTPKFDSIRKHWKAKQKCLEQWEVFNDRTSHPIPWVEYSTEDLEDKAYEIAENMYSGSFFAVPTGVKATFIEVARNGGDPFKVYLDYCGDQISLAIIGPDLSQGSGSHAADKVKKDERSIHSKDLRKICEELYYEQIIKPLCSENYLKSSYPTKYYPRLKFSEVLQVNKTEFMTTIEKGCDLGFIDPTNVEHINFVNKTMGWPLVKQAIKTFSTKNDPGISKDENKDKKAMEIFAYELD